MSNIKISQLPIASAVTGDDFVAMVDSGSLATQQVSFEKVLNYVTSSTFNTLTVTSLTASVIGTFVGDGSGITGVTGEWDGTHTGNAEITGTLSIKNGNVNLTENAYFFQGSSTGGSNVSLIGVNSSDQIFIGNSGYQNIIDDDTYISGNLEVSGAVGIGIASPSTKLDVDGTVRGLKFEGTSDSNYYVRPDSNSYLKTTFFTTSATVNGYTEIGETYIYGQGPVDSFNISSTGNSWFRSNVGIGITSPSELLDVRTSTVTAGQGARIGEAKIGTWVGTDYAEFSHHINSNSSTGYALIQRSNGATALNAKSGQSISFSIANATKMIVNSAGNVEVSGTLRADVEVSGNITAASYTLSAADYGKTLLFSSSATQDITCSSGLDVGYNVTVIQAGTGQLNFSGSGVTLVNRFGHSSSAGQYSAVSVIVLNGTQYLVVGDTA